MTDSASLQFLARVPCLSSSGVDREPAFVRIRARLRWRAHESITPGLNRTRTPPAIQSVAPSLTVVSNAIAAVSSPRWRRLAARTLERSGPNTVGARALAAFVSRGQRLISDFCRRLKVPGNLSSFPLVHDANQPTRGFFHGFQFSPVLSFRAAHVVNSSNGGRECPTKEFPKPENKFPRIA